MSHRSLCILGAALAAVNVSPAAHAQASTPPRAAAAQAKPAAPAARAAKPVARADLVRELNTGYKAMDANGDGGIDQAEIQAAQTRFQQGMNAQFAKRRQAVFAQLDTNKDGQLSQAEFNAGSPPAPRLKRPAPATFIQQFDSNKDQKISPAEFGSTRLAAFDRVDTNRDGIASVDEQQKARAPRK